MTKICDMVMDEGKVLRDWELSTLILIYKGKRDYIAVWVVSGNTAVKTWNKGVLERKLKEVMNINRK